jgi:two-component system OmpR family response regulator
MLEFKLERESDLSASAHILVVDDEPEIAELLRRYLSTQGYHVSTAANGTGMRRRRAEADIDLALMRSLRETSSVPVIVVTGRGEPVDRIIGLEIGADDYITKPFDVRELGARVRSVLRRTSERPDKAASDIASNAVHFAGWTLHLDARRLESPHGKTVELTTGEFELLAALVKSPGRVLSRDELLAATRNREAGPFDRTIDVQIGRLRRKIETDSQHPEMIKSVRGAGYVFTAKVS